MLIQYRNKPRKMLFFFLFLLTAVLSNPVFIFPSPVQSVKACEPAVLAPEPSASPVPNASVIPVPPSALPMPVPEPSAPSISIPPSTLPVPSASVIPVPAPSVSVIPVPPTVLPVPVPAPSASIIPVPPIVTPVPVPAPNASVKPVPPSISPVQAPVPGDMNVCNSTLTGNPTDDCWRYDPNWAINRQRLATCGVGFGKNAIGGMNGTIYVVTDPKDDPEDPQIGTLRYGVIQDEPLWIIFARNMLISLKESLEIKSFKTIDGRGVNVSITASKSTCLDIKDVSNVIIHGLEIHDCAEDGVTVTKSNDIWVDHCTLSSCGDGLIDVVDGSTAITISNNHMKHHDKVMLLGNSDDDVQDKKMQVTVAFNHFGEGLVQRMPRCRFGYFHVVNNDYTHWGNYAIGGSSSPTINSQGNRFLDTDKRSSKKVSRRLNAPAHEWRKWNWRSEGDLFLNGTVFVPSGSRIASTYDKATSLRALPSSMVPILTRDAGVLNCQIGKCC